MQEYRRRIAYLHACGQGMQTHSVGFVKTEERAGRCRLTVHLKEYCDSGEDAGTVYIYFCHQNHIVGITLGRLEKQNDALEWRGELSLGNVLDKGICFARMKGIWIRQPGDRDYVAQWEDSPVDAARFVLYPGGGMKCIRCPRFGRCVRSRKDETDRRGKIYEGGHPPGP